MSSERTDYNEKTSMNYGMIAGNFVLGFGDFYIWNDRMTLCEISLILSVDFQRNKYYSLFVTLLSKVIDSRLIPLIYNLSLQDFKGYFFNTREK